MFIANIRIYGKSNAPKIVKLHYPYYMSIFLLIFKYNFKTYDREDH